MAAQIPNLFLNWLNIFFNLGYVYDDLFYWHLCAFWTKNHFMKSSAFFLVSWEQFEWDLLLVYWFVFGWTFYFSGSLTPRIVWSIIIEVIVFIVTVGLAMIPTNEWPDIFFWVTMGSIVVLNSKYHWINAIFFNGIAGYKSYFLCYW